MRRLAAVLVTVVVSLLGMWAAPTRSADAIEARAPILVLGDSLCVGARDGGGNMTAQLQAAGWEPEYICAVGQPITWGINHVRALDSVPSTVVVALGTNPGPTEVDFAGRLATMRAELHARGARNVIWVNYAIRADGYTVKNHTLALYTVGYGDLHVDWNARIQANSQWFLSDGLHYTADGKAAWARAVAEVSELAHLRSVDTAVGVAVLGDAKWILMASGEVYIDGTAAHFGDVLGLALNGAPRAIVPTVTGQGYWIMGADGGVFSFGDAHFYGSTGAMRLNAPVVSMAATHSGSGYWLLARDGGVFSFGDAHFHGSTGSMRLNAPVVGMAAVPTGGGYWLVATDGGVFTFGSASFHGSTGSIRLSSPVNDMATSPTGLGYWLAASDGGVFAFGDASFKGSATGHGSPAVAIEALASGYVQLLADGRILAWP
jgi:hypothetical protein